MWIGAAAIADDESGMGGSFRDVVCRSNDEVADFSDFAGGIG